MDFRIVTALSLACALGGAFFGWTMRGVLADRDMLAFQNTMAEQSMDAMAKVRMAEQGISDAVIQASGEALTGEQQAHDDYARLVACPLPVRVPESIRADSDSVPGTPGAAKGAAGKEKCRCPKQDARKLQDLYRRQLEIARDCDVTAARYNALLSIYEAARNKSQPSK